MTHVQPVKPTYESGREGNKLWGMRCFATLRETRRLVLLNSTVAVIKTWVEAFTQLPGIMKLFSATSVEKSGEELSINILSIMNLCATVAGM